ncbi:MAG: BlaI/MecI/CopY family transcriptional regulator [Chitinophagaceae bacterium]|nr:BlaI/MecI/CopY family transcriptional regulator [Chitinophagaceae bacterium]
MTTLTRAEEQIMQKVWKMNGGFLKEIVESMSKPKPHQNTVATILKILSDKGFIKVESIGRNHKYHPAISKADYSKRTMKSFVKRFFDGSFSNVVSAMVKENNMSLGELEQLVKQLKKEKK